jgi:hypothetical protein
MAVKSLRDPRFIKLLGLLPAHIQALAMKNFLLWRHDHRHPSLDFKEWKPGYWSVRLGAPHRAQGLREGDRISWYWIGSHEAYNKLLRR